MRKITTLLTFVGMFISVVLSTNANAVSVIDFRTGLERAGGTISFDGTDVFGRGIAIGAVEVHGAPQGNGVYTADARLNFDTAANTISIFGTVDTLVGIPTTLMSGSFDSFSYSVDPVGNEIFTGMGHDSKACALICELGLADGTPFFFDGFVIETANGVVISTDIVNTVIPVPPTVWLFGSGLLGLVAVTRRRAKLG